MADSTEILRLCGEIGGTANHKTVGRVYWDGVAAEEFFIAGSTKRLDPLQRLLKGASYEFGKRMETGASDSV